MLPVKKLAFFAYYTCIWFVIAVASFVFSPPSFLLFLVLLAFCYINRACHSLYEFLFLVEFKVRLGLVNKSACCYGGATFIF